MFQEKKDWSKRYSRLAMMFWGGDPYNFASNFYRKELYKEINKIYRNTIEETIAYIAFNEGWEETEDKYRKHFGFKPKYIKN